MPERNFAVYLALVDTYGLL